MDVSGRILRIWMPAIHAGMTVDFEALSPLILFTVPVTLGP